MRKYFLALVLPLFLILTGCGELVEVPSAHVAKIMTKDGYKEQVIPTSKFRLDFCVVYCDKAVILNASDVSVGEQMTLFMPEDKLNMSFDLRLTLVVNPSKYEEVFARIPPSKSNDGIDYIEWGLVYKTYAQQIIRAEAREFLSGFTIGKIASSREEINSQLSQRLSTAIEQRTPFMVRYVGLADIQYPSIIVTAQENAAERREALNAEQAQLEISKVQLERELQEQQMRRKIEVEKAEATAHVNKILAESMTPEFVRYRSLEILDSIASSDNKVFVPMGMLDSVASQVQLGRE